MPAIIVDKVLWPAFAAVQPRLGDIPIVVISDDGDVPPGTLDYEQLVTSATPTETLGRRRRAFRCGDVLHIGHHGAIQGRAVLAPLDGAARVDPGAARLPQSARVRHGPCRRPDVPCECVGPAVCVRDARKQPGAAGPLPGRGQPGRVVRDRARDAHGGRADDLARRAQVPRRAPRPRPVVDSRDDRRRRRDSRIDPSRVRRATRPARRARVGHDRDEPDRVDQPRPVRACARRRPTTSTRGARRKGARLRWWRSAHEATPGWSHGTARRWASSKCAGRGSRRRTTPATWPWTAGPRTAGSAPATS